MNIRKIGVVLLALLLAGMAMVPMVSAAAEQGSDSQVAAGASIGFSVPEHYLSPEYFANSKPATPLPESDMISLIFSERILDTLGQEKSTGIIKIPVSSPKLDKQFTESGKYINWFTEKDIRADEPVVLVRMPMVMYDRFLASSKDNLLTVPASNFAKYYKNLAELESQVMLEGDVMTVNHGEQDAAMLEKLAATPSVIETPAITGMGKTAGLKSALLTPQGPNTSHNEWAFFTRANSNSLDYCIGRITPDTYWVSGNSNKYFSPHEREYYLGPNRKEAIEIVVNYDHYTSYPHGKVTLFPAIYDDHSNASIPMNRWENQGAGIIQLNTGTFPHSYGYHVQIYNGKYYITFQDMSNGQWFSQYVYNDQDNPSTTFTEFSGSTEFQQITSPITDSFYYVTKPVIDEWAHVSGGSWQKPRTAWIFETQTANENFVHINWFWGGSGNQELVTESYIYSGWA